MPGGTGLLPLFKEFPDRLIDVGICDVAVQDLSVVFAMDRAGIVGDDGRTHQGLYDIAYLRPLPGFTLMAPKDEAELRDMLWTAFRHASAARGSVGVRFPRGTGFGVPLDRLPRDIPIGLSETLREGSDLAIVAYGQPVNAALEAAESLASSGVQATVVNARFAKPLDAERLLALAGARRASSRSRSTSSPVASARRSRSSSASAACASTSRCWGSPTSTSTTARRSCGASITDSTRRGSPRRSDGAGRS
jgi:1-deoxy-D-xylulose-5-phosphate synthase